MKFAYADPPYFKQGKKLYGNLHPDAAIFDAVDAHLKLVDRLTDEYPDGWALSCNPADLRWLLPQCPEDARVAAWTKTFHQIRPTTVQYAWEPVIFRGGRKNNKRNPMIRDWLSEPATRRKGTPGAKPNRFNHWILDLLNYDQNHDTLDDLFPGFNGMAQALAEMKLAL